MGCSWRERGAVPGISSGGVPGGVGKGEQLLHPQAVGEVRRHGRTTVNRIEEPPHQRRHRAQAAIDLRAAAFVFEYAGQAAGGARPHVDAESCGVIGTWDCCRTSVPLSP